MRYLDPLSLELESVQTCREWCRYPDIHDFQGRLAARQRVKAILFDVNPEGTLRDTLKKAQTAEEACEGGLAELLGKVEDARVHDPRSRTTQSFQKHFIKL